MSEKVKTWLKRLPAGTGLAKILWITAGVLVAGTVVNGARYAIRYGSIPTVTETTVTKSTLDEEATKKLLSAGQERIAGLQKKSPFAPPAAKPNPPVCVGIFGPMAIIGDKGYLVGESVNGAKILRINPSDVVIEWEGKEMTLVPFSIENGPQGGGRGEGGPRGDQPQQANQPQPGQAPTVRVEGGENRVMGGPPEGRFQFQPSAEMRQRMEQMRERFENASPEERERMRQEFRQNREGMGFGGPGMGGPGMRGG
ncbi:MAG: hypothetical protein GX455_03395 [Phycisphaerae bacterium]|nr:hypothetical protein [Phycisphaerae bacterium]